MIFPDLCYGVLCYGTHRFSELLANTGADGMFSRQIARCNHHKRKAEAVEL